MPDHTTELVERLESVKSDLESLCTCNASMAEEVLDDTGIHPWECECPEPWAQKQIDAIEAILTKVKGQPANA